ncbi:MAG: hypothetical protein PVSMB11_02220 [Desulfuromonadaceae bacterium]
MTLNADIAIIVAGLAGLKIPASLTGMIAGPLVRGHKSTGMAGLALGRVETFVSRPGWGQFDIAELATVRFELNLVTWKFGVALAAVLLVMTAQAALRVVLGFEWMKCTEVAAVAFGFVIPAKILGGEIHA